MMLPEATGAPVDWLFALTLGAPTLCWLDEVGGRWMGPGPE